MSLLVMIELPFRQFMLQLPFPRDYDPNELFWVILVLLSPRSYYMDVACS
jgi:hypothetical protein